MTTLTSNPSMPNTQPTEVITMNPALIESPSAWMQYGTSPTEIILATGVVNVGVIVAVNLLAQVLVRVMQSNPPQKKK